jgi:hypothetical protein
LTRSCLPATTWLARTAPWTWFRFWPKVRAASGSQTRGPSRPKQLKNEHSYHANSFWEFILRKTPQTPIENISRNIIFLAFFACIKLVASEWESYEDTLSNR